MTTYSIPPTVLYIKQHSITGLKYFGKTTKDPLKYKGSGKHWARHLKKHGKEYVVNLWISEPYTDKDDIVEFALAFSKDNNIVESKEWANIRPENGLDGGGNKGVPHTDTTKKKVSETRKYLFSIGSLVPHNKGKPGKPWSDERKAKSKGTKRTELSKQRQSKSTTGVPKSESHKQSLSVANKGQVPYSKDKPMLEEQKKLLSIIQRNKPPIICPHCNKVGFIGGMLRWHFDNCRLYQSPLG